MHNRQTASRCELYFYQGSNLSIAMGVANTRLLWAGAIACGQLSNRDAATAVFQCDQANTIMGSSRKARAQMFSPYGFMEPQRSTTLVTFTGQRLDKLTGNYPLGHGNRDYNPRTMRLNQPDALSPFGKGGLNSYSYCFADPINRYDPTGRWPQWMMNIKRRLFGGSAQAPQAEIQLQALRVEALELPDFRGARLPPPRRDSNDSGRGSMVESGQDVAPLAQHREAALPHPHIAAGTSQQIGWRDAVRMVISFLPTVSVEWVVGFATKHVMQGSPYAVPVTGVAALTASGGTFVYLNRKLVKKIISKIRRQR
ncbi:RHS repeat-associated core domain-containing protein [Pseudomonas alloputida]|uniref:RHS repeat-associated core domain-containing protein n=1 Tax=Pseudomonas TaxID=286 RepID=UPI003EEA94E4